MSTSHTGAPVAQPTSPSLAPAGSIPSAAISINVPMLELRRLVDRVRNANCVVAVVSRALPQDDFAEERLALQQALDSLHDIHGLLDDAVPRLDELEEGS